MPTFLYRWPNTGKNVQGWIADDPVDRDDDNYEAITCLACARIHLVNPKTGKVMGEDGKKEHETERCRFVRAGSPRQARVAPSPRCLVVQLSAISLMPVPPWVSARPRDASKCGHGLDDMALRSCRR